MSKGFDAAMESLNIAYGRKNVLYPLLIEEFPRQKYDYSQESMWQILDKSERLAQDLIKIGGDSIQNLLAAIIIRDFDPELQTELTK